MKIRKGDTVLITSGKDKGKKGKIQKAFPRQNLVVIDGANIIKRHTRPRGQARQAGIIEREAPIAVANAMLLCTKCNRATRVGIRRLEDGSRVRLCKRCKEIID